MTKIVYFRAEEDEDIPEVFGPFPDYESAARFCIKQRNEWLAENSGYEIQENPTAPDYFGVLFTDNPDDVVYTYWMVGELVDPETA